MLKQMAWNTFKNTGNINTFMELIEIENTKKKSVDFSTPSLNTVPSARQTR